MTNKKEIDRSQKGFRNKQKIQKTYQSKVQTPQIPFNKGTHRICSQSFTNLNRLVIYRYRQCAQYFLTDGFVCILLTDTFGMLLYKRIYIDRHFDTKMPCIQILALNFSSQILKTVESSAHLVTHFCQVLDNIFFFACFLVTEESLVSWIQHSAARRSRLQPLLFGVIGSTIMICKRCRYPFTQLYLCLKGFYVLHVECNLGSRPIRTSSRLGRVT